MDFQPQRPHQLLAVYPDEQTAERVIVELRDRFQAPTHEGRREDRRDALNAEMSDEMRASFAAPQAGIIYPKEAMKTAAWMFPVSILAGVVIMVPLALLLVPRTSMSGGARAVIGGLIGAALGATIALVLMALGEKNPDEPMAAERGVTVRVDDDGDELRRVMLAAHPIRLDVVDDRGRPIETIAAEPDTSLEPETFNDRQKNWP